MPKRKEIIIAKFRKYKVDVRDPHTLEWKGSGFAFIEIPACGHEECGDNFVELIAPDGSVLSPGFYDVQVGKEVLEELFLLPEPERTQ